MRSAVLNFAHDNKLFNIHKAKADFAKLQEDLSKWSKQQCQTKCCIGEDKMMHMGQKIPTFDICRWDLNRLREKDLAVMHSSMKMSIWCTAIIKKNFLGK